MSKRLRLETERCLAIKDEEREEEDKLKLIKERIYAPIVWKRLTSGICIKDVKEKDFQAVLDFIQEYFIPEDVLCRNSEMIKDKVSLKSFLDQCLFKLKDTSSIMAVDEGNENEIVGVLLMRVVCKDDFGRVFSRTIMTAGKAQQKCIQIKTALNRRVDIYAEFDCESFLQIYLVAVKPTHRTKGIGFTMMRCAHDVARTLHVPVLMGIFNNYSSQRCAKKIGLQILAEVNYVEWRDKDKNLVFDDPGAGNYSCALMAGLVPPETTREPVKPTTEQPVVEEKKSKTTRKEKRDAVKKKK